jgi:hypothetical protein
MRSPDRWLLRTCRGDGRRCARTVASVDTEELIRLCPIDGPLRSAHRPGTRIVQEFRDAAHQIERQLHAQGDTSWARLFAEDLARPPDEFLTYLGHSLAFLVRRGPVLENGFTRDELEQLLVDTVATWPPRKEYPTIWARWKGGPVVKRAHIALRPRGVAGRSQG